MRTLRVPLHVAAGQGRAVSVAGDVYTIKADGEQTGGAYALFDFVVGPGGGPPPHVHHREDEAFFVLAGEVTFTVDGREIEAAPGSFVDAPKDIPHSFRNSGTEPARMLCWVYPAGLERFFLEVGVPVPGGDAPGVPVDQAQIDRLLAAAPHYGLEILPPAQGPE